MKRLFINKPLVVLIAFATTFLIWKTYSDIANDYQQTIKSAENLSDGFSRALSEHALRTFKDAENSIDFASRNIKKLPSQHFPSQKQLYDILKTSQADTAIFHNLFIINADGMVAALTSEFPVRDIDTSNRAIFRFHKSNNTNQIYISQPYKSAISGHWLLAISKRISNKDGSLRMIVGTSLDTAYFSSFYSSLHLGINDRILLIRKDGALLTQAPFDATSAQSSIAESEFFRHLLLADKQSGTLHIEKGAIDGTSRIISFASSSYPIISYVSLDRDHVLRPWLQRSTASAGVCLLILTLSGLILLNMHRRNQEMQYRLLFENAGDGIFIHDAGGRILSTNNTACEKLGYSTKELTSMLFSEIKSSSIGVRTGDRSMEMLKKQGSLSYETVLLCRDGSLLPTEINTRLITWNGQNAAMSICRDISERKRLQDLLQQSHDLLYNLTIQVPGVIFQFKLFPDGKFTFPYVSDAIKKVLEVRPEDACHDAFKAFARIHPEDFPLLVSSLRASANSLKHWHFEFRGIFPKKGERWCQGDAKPQLLEDGSVLWHGYFTDITERKSAEQQQTLLIEQLRQAQKMESIGMLAGGMAHDFNNLIQAMLGFIALTKLDTDADSDTAEYLNTMEKIAWQASDLGHLLLSLSRGDISATEASVLEPLIEESVTETLKDTHISVKFNNSPAPLLVKYDKTQMQQVVRRLATNALEAMPDSGELAISVRERSISSEDGLNLAAGLYMHISFTDSGAGIPPEHMHRIFDPYFTTKEIDSRKGLGLGLAICHAIITKHNGALLADSIPGLGTTFHIYLPAEATQTEEMSGAASPGHLSAPSL